MTVNEKNKAQENLSVKQPKVKTSHYNKKDKIKRLLRVLQNSPEGSTPKYLAFQTNINRNTVKTIILELEKSGMVKKKQGLRGYYVLVENSSHALLSFNLQNLNLSYNLPSNIIIQERIGRVEGHFSELIKYEFGIGKESRKATMHISTDFPFNVSAVTLIVYFFKQLVENYTGINPANSDIEVTSFELNKDYLNQKMEGCNCITFETFIASFKAYNKRNALREEYKIKQPIRADFLIKIVTQGLLFTEITLKEDSILDEVRELKKVLSKMSSILQTILEKRFFDSKTGRT